MPQAMCKRALHMTPCAQKVYFTNPIAHKVGITKTNTMICRSNWVNYLQWTYTLNGMNNVLMCGSKKWTTS